MDEGMTIENEELRKREAPFAGRLTAETAAKAERATYYGAYKGVTDVLTKYLCPELALVLTRLAARIGMRSEEHTSELQSLMRISYAVFCLKKNKKHIQT